MSTPDSLAQKIRAARNEAGLSREKLAGELGVSLVTLVRYETGRSTDITVKKLVGIAQATGKPLSYFLGAEVAA